MIFDSCYFSIIKTLIGFVDIFNLNVFLFIFHVNFSSRISIFYCIRRFFISISVLVILVHQV